MTMPNAKPIDTKMKMNSTTPTPTAMPLGTAAVNVTRMERTSHAANAAIAIADTPILTRIENLRLIATALVRAVSKDTVRDYAAALENGLDALAHETLHVGETNRRCVFALNAELALATSWMRASEAQTKQLKLEMAVRDRQVLTLRNALATALAEEDEAAKMEMNAIATTTNEVFPSISYAPTPTPTATPLGTAAVNVTRMERTSHAANVAIAVADTPILTRIENLRLIAAALVRAVSKDTVRDYAAALENGLDALAHEMLHVGETNRRCVFALNAELALATSWMRASEAQTKQLKLEMAVRDRQVLALRNALATALAQQNEVASATVSTPSTASVTPAPTASIVLDAVDDDDINDENGHDNDGDKVNVTGGESVSLVQVVPVSSITGTSIQMEMTAVTAMQTTKDVATVDVRVCMDHDANSNDEDECDDGDDVDEKLRFYRMSFLRHIEKDVAIRAGDFARVRELEREESLPNAHIDLEMMKARLKTAVSAVATMNTAAAPTASIVLDAVDDEDVNDDGFDADVDSSEKWRTLRMSLRRNIDMWQANRARELARMRENDREASLTDANIDTKMMKAKTKTPTATVISTETEAVATAGSSLHYETSAVSVEHRVQTEQRHDQGATRADETAMKRLTLQLATRNREVVSLRTALAHAQQREAAARAATTATAALVPTLTASSSTTGWLEATVPTASFAYLVVCMCIFACLG